MPAALLASLLLTAAAPSAAVQGALDASVTAVYQPYRTSNPAADWQRPIYSAETRALIARWERVRPEGEEDDLDGSDWICMCQDWDARKFRGTIRSRTFTSATAAVVNVRVDVGFGAGSLHDARLSMKQENGRWKVDDIFADGFFPHGLKQALRETTIADQKLPK